MKIKSFVPLYQRRHFLKKAFLSFLTCSLLGRPQAQGAPIDENILIIGGGISGLAAAQYLKRKGFFHVTVIEARNRLGGRVWTDYSMGAPLDMGAAWIHGLKGNPITQLARSAGANLIDTDYDSLYLYDEIGGLTNDRKVEDMWGEFESLMHNIEALAVAMDEDLSVASAIKQTLGDTELTSMQRIFLNWCLGSMEVASGAEMNELSLRYADQDESFKGGDAFFSEGYDQIVTHLAKGVSVHLEEEVQEIQSYSSLAVVVTKKRTYKADRVIITLPLGVLKSEKVQFLPKFSKRRQQAIARLGMGVLNKVAMRFPAVFWPKDRHFLGYMSKHLGEFPEFFNMAAHTGDPILIAYAGGGYAKKMEDQGLKKTMNQLSKILKKMYGKMMIEPMQSKMTQWGSDPYALGAYSHIPIGAKPQDFDVLSEPISERLFFAGEATIRDYYGTVHGAYLSGIREAQRILRFSSQSRRQ